ncbi:MAG: YdcF family protein, partial [Leptolyngbyaceae cyanobacterium SM1_3_5]|nr:YdcF family protein [Leptolyngbyaceae cyanobacterium SM1_3_5]
MKKRRLKFLQWAVIGSAAVLASVLLLIAVRLSIAANQAPQPQAILTLGGDPNREKAAAQLAKHYPSLEVWVSTGETPQTSTQIF